MLEAELIKEKKAQSVLKAQQIAALLIQPAIAQGFSINPSSADVH